MKILTTILIIILPWQTNSFGQDFMEWDKEANYVPNLILKGVGWQVMLDSIRINYPNKIREIDDVSNTVEYEKSPRTDSLSTLLNKFFDSKYNQNLIFHNFKLVGKSAIPSLIEYLDKDYATRYVYTSPDWDERYIYFCISDIAIQLIEEISGIYFFKNYAFPLRRLSDSPIEERKKITEILLKWYEETEGLSKTEAINYYLETFHDNNLGSKIYTAKNLAVYGDTINAIRHLERMYNYYKLPCRTNFLIVEMASELGKDLALEDCLHDIFDYRCMADNGLHCVSHIFKNGKSDIPFDVLADIVSTERFSRYKRTSSRFIWHSVFNEIATTKSTWTKSILVELLSIDDELKDSKIIAPNWERLYKEQFESKFRVCDFSLYKMNELYPELNISVDWNNRASINEEIRRIIEKENGG